MENHYDDQVIFKLGMIEASVKSISENLTASVLRLEEKITDSIRNHSSNIAELRAENKHLEQRVEFLENFRAQLFTKMGFVVSGVSVFWMAFTQPLENVMNKLFG